MRYLFRATFVFCFATIAGFGLPSQVHAGGHGGGHGAAEEAAVEEIVEGVEVTLKLDLGTIEVVNVEPTRGRTSRMSFDLHLTFYSDTDPKQIKALDGWHHRLREQVIVGVRATEVHDFIDPELKRFRKQMLYRINRLLGNPIVSDVLFANFTFFSE
jgi:hypothetical protein